MHLLHALAVGDYYLNEHAHLNDCIPFWFARRLATAPRFPRRFPKVDARLPAQEQQRRRGR